MTEAMVSQTANIISQENVPAGDVNIEALKNSILAQVEAKFTQKTEALMHRGQVEIRKLQLEQQQTAAALVKVQERQVALNAETRAMETAIVEVTTQFGQVVGEMREVLRRMQGAQQAQQPQRAPECGTLGTVNGRPALSPASVSTKTPEKDDYSPSADCSMLSSSIGAMTTDHKRTPLPFSTPERHSAQAFDFLRSCQTPAQAPAAMAGSPAVLQLASVLPSASSVAGTTTMPSPSPLRLAECLGNATTPSSSAAVVSTLQASSQPQEVAPATKAEYVNIELNKESGFVTVGMEVNQLDSPACLLIEGIDEHGLVGRHNAKTDAEASRVLVGDRIIEVNGVGKDPVKMLNECKVKQRLVFTIARGNGVGEGGETPHGTSDAPAKSSGISSPVPTRRLRPEARVFVPSASQQDVVPPGLMVPPGLGCLESYDLGPLVLPGLVPATAPMNPDLTSLVAAGHHGSPDETVPEEIKRALFP